MFTGMAVGRGVSRCRCFACLFALCKGIITAPNMSYKGAMQNAPALKEAYELGKGL